MSDRSGNANSALYLNVAYMNYPAAVYFYTDFTITAWVYSKSVRNYGRFMSCGQNLGALDGALIDIAISQYTNSYPFFCVSPNCYFSKTYMAQNSWQFIALVNGGNVGSLYLNNVKIVSGTSTTAGNGVRSTCYLGRASDPANDYFYGYIDEIRFFNTALSTTSMSSVSTYS